MLRIVIAAAAALALLAGCGGDRGESAAASEFDRAFIDGMVPHHQAALEMAKAAKGAGLAEPELVELADAILVTQQREIDQMREWRADWFGSRTSEPGGAAALELSAAEMGMQHEADELRAAQDVDAAFARMMIDHHQGAVRMGKLALERSERDELRELAQDIVDTQEREIAVLEKHADGAHGH